jgi:hypothetical protein
MGALLAAVAVALVFEPRAHALLSPGRAAQPHVEAERLEKRAFARQCAPDQELLDL